MIFLYDKLKRQSAKTKANFKKLFLKATVRAVIKHVMLKKRLKAVMKKRV